MNCHGYNPPEERIYTQLTWLSLVRLAAVRRPQQCHRQQKIVMTMIYGPEEEEVEVPPIEIVDHFS